MSHKGLWQPSSIKSIASKCPLPVIIQPALGFRGSNQAIILHSVTKITFAFGRTLKLYQSRRSDYQAYKSINSEYVAVPLQYPGYFECLTPSRHGAQDGVVPEKSIRSIVHRMQGDRRPQAFYIAHPLKVYSLERKNAETIHRTWRQIEAHQMITFDQLTQVEYTPTELDNLTDEDYAYPWWLCFSQEILNRQENVLKCILSDEQICYIPSSTTDKVSLIPVGQRGSKNTYKLQTIQNLIEQFPLPINIKLAALPGSLAYRDFKGQLQLLGTRTVEFAICASLSSTNIALIPMNIPTQFVMAPISLGSQDISKQLSRCHMFLQSFDMQIRRVLMLPHEQRSKNRPMANIKRTSSCDRNSSPQADGEVFTDESHRSRATTPKKPNQFRIQRAISVDNDRTPPSRVLEKKFSIDDDSVYDSLVRPNRSTTKTKPTSPVPPPLPKKPANFPHFSTSFTYDTGNDLTKLIDSPDADGAIFMEHSELSPAVAKSRV